MAVGLLAMQLNDLDAAETYLTQALDAGFKDDDTVRIYLGQVEEARKRYDAAAQWYLSVASGDNYLDARIRYASLLARQEKVQEARAALRALAEESELYLAQAAQAEAQILRERKDYQGAFDLLSDALNSRPNSPDLLYDRAMVAERLSRLDLMEQDLRQLIQVKPDHAHAYNALGYTLADHSIRLEEAIQLLNKALKLAPEDPFILDSMGWAQYRAGRHDLALDYLRRAYSGRPDPEIAAHLGEVLWVTGDREGARSIWEASLKTNPRNEVLIEVMSRFKP
jgi:tetratricopeptide (TPR) repeat protein